MSVKWSIQRAAASMPSKSKGIVWFELVQKTGIHPMRLSELIEMGWLDPLVTMNKEYIFQEKDLYRINKLLRLCRDFELSTQAAVIVCDLLDRIEYLEQEVRQLRDLL